MWTASRGVVEIFSPIDCAGFSCADAAGNGGDVQRARAAEDGVSAAKFGLPESTGDDGSGNGGDHAPEDGVARAWKPSRNRRAVRRLRVERRRRRDGELATVCQASLRKDFESGRGRVGSRAKRRDYRRTRRRRGAGKARDGG